MLSLSFINEVYYIHRKCDYSIKLWTRAIVTSNSHFWDGVSIYVHVSCSARNQLLAEKITYLQNRPDERITSQAGRPDKRGPLVCQRTNSFTNRIMFRSNFEISKINKYTFFIIEFFYPGKVSRSILNLIREAILNVSFSMREVRYYILFRPHRYCWNRGSGRVVFLTN